MDKLYKYGYFKATFIFSIMCHKKSATQSQRRRIEGENNVCENGRRSGKEAENQIFLFGKVRRTLKWVLFSRCSVRYRNVCIQCTQISIHRVNPMQTLFHSTVGTGNNLLHWLLPVQSVNNGQRTGCPWHLWTCYIGLSNTRSSAGLSVYTTNVCMKLWRILFP